MHGNTIDGNEPFVMVYNPKIEPKSDIRIDIVDVAPTLSLYFGIDIPANSMGLTNTYFGKRELVVMVTDKVSIKRMRI
jgi:hypothetical protein